jgi:hypothetical protein
MTMSPVGLGIKNNPAGEDQQQLSHFLKLMLSEHKYIQNKKQSNLYHLNKYNNNSYVEVQRFKDSLLNTLCGQHSEFSQC